jgi:hypothetical protein
MPVLDISQGNDRRAQRLSKNMEARVLAVGLQHEQCYMVSNTSSSLQFNMVIANNHSAHDAYSLSLDLIEPLIRVGDISFEHTHNINKSTFIKHYFPDLHLALHQQDPLLEHYGITHHSKIIPVYFTLEDYD